MKTTVLGHANITSTVIADSITASGKRITTLEIEYPRFILAEFNTHRMISKNSSSSRAIPTKKILENLEHVYARPVMWGKNQSGMQAREELDPVSQAKAHLVWMQARNDAIWNSYDMLDLAVHKQIVNRITEPYQIMKTVCTSTEWQNLWWLRDHEDAQPEFRELVRVMQKSMDTSKPNLLLVGEWHLPYLKTKRVNSVLEYWCGEEKVTLEVAKQISASSCAQVSYRKLDQSLEKAQDIYERLILSDPPHMSPCEHQATPMPSQSSNPMTPWPLGITHRDRSGNWWSANFMGWIQYRKCLPNEAKW